METLNDRIKKLRKDAGMTQADLAEKLGVTDKAVSKWESGDGDPSLSLLTSLASTFDVTVDYLLTGKKEETISMDDMDSEKREMLLIKKDDVDNFIKYGCLNPYIVLCPAYSSGKTSRSFETKVLDAIYANKSKKIFVSLVKVSLEKENELTQNLYNYDNIKALTVCGDLDKYIRMCSESGCVEGLKFIDFKYFRVSDKTSSERSYFHIREGDGPASRDYCTCTVSLDTLKFVLNPKTSSDAVIEYVSEIELFKAGGKKVYFITDEVILSLYENGDEKRLRNIIDILKTNNKYAADIYNESLRDSWYTGKSIHGNAIYFSNSYGGGSYLRAYIYPISLALNLALNQKDFKWVKEFNDYNGHLKALLTDLKLKVYSEKELKIMDVEFNPNSTIEQIWEEKYVVDGILDARAYLSGIILCEKEELASLKEAKRMLKDQILPFLIKYPVCGRELIAKGLINKDFKLLYKFAVDKQNKELEEAVLSGSKENILKIANNISNFGGFENELTADELSLDFFENYKIKYIDSRLDKIDEIIEKITQEKKLENDYKDTMNKIDHEYLVSELLKGNRENVIIKLCVRLEMIFRYVYRYDGDLVDQLNTYFKVMAENAPKPREVDDGWGYMVNDDKYEEEEVKPAQARLSFLRNLFYKLRVNRNNIVHPNSEKIESLSNEELVQCIEEICKM